jgi:sec-independent protein translocase protein TatB
MFDLGWQEFFLIATIAVIVVGPKDLPNVIRTVVGWIRKVRSMARDFQGSIEEVAREAELDEIRREAAKLNSQDLKQSILDTVDPDGDVTNTLKAAKADIEAEGELDENAMLDPRSARDLEVELTPEVSDPVKGWAPETVTTPASSVTPPVEAKPAPKPAPTPTPEKAESKAKPAAKSAAKTKSGATRKTAAGAKPRKPRAAKPKAPGAVAADKPASEA